MLAQDVSHIKEISEALKKYEVQDTLVHMVNEIPMFIEWLI